MLEDSKNESMLRSLEKFRGVMLTKTIGQVPLISVGFQFSSLSWQTGGDLNEG